MDVIKNFAYSTVATAPFPATSGASLIVQTGDGAQFPSGSFQVIAWPSGVIPRASNAEIMRCTVAGDTFTLTRGQEGSTQQPIAIGYQIAAGITALVIAEILAACDPAGSAATAQANAEVYALGLLETVYSVGGHPYFTLTNTNPNTILGFGTWVNVGKGSVLMGVGLGTDFNGNTFTAAVGDPSSPTPRSRVSQEEYTHKLSAVESGQPGFTYGSLSIPGLSIPGLSIPGLSIPGLGIPSLSVFGNTNSGLTDGGYDIQVGSTQGLLFAQSGTVGISGSTSGGTTGGGTTGGGTTGGSTTGGGTTGTSSIAAAAAANSHNNIEPYFGLYIWQRTA